MNRDIFFELNGIIGRDKRFTLKERIWLQQTILDLEDYYAMRARAIARKNLKFRISKAVGVKKQ